MRFNKALTFSIALNGFLFLLVLLLIGFLLAQNKILEIQKQQINNSKIANAACNVGPVVNADTENNFSVYLATSSKKTVIKLNNLNPNQTISSPFELTGEAPGTWFFEGSFPVSITDWDGKIIASGAAQAQSEWMTEKFVPFKINLEFVKPNLYNRGSLIIKNDNPSGLPEHDDYIEIPILFN